MKQSAANLLPSFPCPSLRRENDRRQGDDLLTRRRTAALTLLTRFGSNAPRIVTWDMTTGDLESDLRKPGYESFKEVYSYANSPLQWLPDSSGWLVYDQFLVERNSGQIAWTVPFDDQKHWEQGPRKFLDGEYVVIVTKPAREKMLKLEKVPRERVQRAMELVKTGGAAADATLHALTAIDRSSAKRITPSTDAAGAWKVTADPAASAKTAFGQQITFPLNPMEVLSIHLSGPESPQAFIVANPRGTAVTASTSQSRRSAHHDELNESTLPQARPMSSFEIPSGSSPSAVSPSGSSIVMISGVGQDRLDLASTEATASICSAGGLTKESPNQVNA